MARGGPAPPRGFRRTGMTLSLPDQTPRDALEHPLLQQLQAYWDRCRGDRPMPARADLDPADIKPVLPYLILIDVEPEPLRFRVRLAGTFAYEAREGLRVREMTGRYLDELDYHLGAPEAVVGLARSVAVERRPVARITPYPLSGGQSGVHHLLVLPLGRDPAQVDMLLVGAVIARGRRD